MDRNSRGVLKGLLQECSVDTRKMKKYGEGECCSSRRSCLAGGVNKSLHRLNSIGIMFKRPLLGPWNPT